MSKTLRSDSIALINGEIYPMDSPNRFSALYAEGGIIKAIGNDRDILLMCGSKTVVLDMKGKYLMPGFTDTHALLLSIGKKLAKDKSDLSENNFKTWYAKAIKEMLRLGITSVQTNDIFILGTIYNVLDFYIEMKSIGNITPRITPQLYIENVTELCDFINSKKYKDYKSEFLNSLPIKIRVDGILKDRTAALKEEYSDKRKAIGTYEYSQDELNEIVKIAQQENIQIIFQATGDGAIDRCLNAIEKHMNASSVRHRIESCKVAYEDTYRRMKGLGVMAGISPASLNDDMHRLLKRLGAERSRICDSWKSMVINDISIGAGSDGFNELNPCVGIRTLIFRQDENGEPKYGWIPSQRLDRVEAFDIYTLGGAKVCAEDSFRGILSVGKAADIIAFMENPFTASYDEFFEIKVGLTIVDGKIAYLQ